MDVTRKESHGFSIGRWFFPPFTVRRGECITLELPQPARLDCDRIIAAFTGSEPPAGLNFHSMVALAEPARSTSGWKRWFYDPTPFDWLRKKTRLSVDAIKSIVTEHDMDRHVPLSRYAGTPKLICGLFATYARQPDVIIFATEGIDPSGVQAVFRIVSQHLSECAAVYLGWPYTSQGQELRDVFPGSLSVAVVDTAIASGVRSNAAVSK